MSDYPRIQAWLTVIGLIITMLGGAIYGYVSVQVSLARHDTKLENIERIINSNQDKFDRIDKRVESLLYMMDRFKLYPGSGQPSQKAER